MVAGDGAFGAAFDGTANFAGADAAAAAFAGAMAFGGAWTGAFAAAAFTATLAATTRRRPVSRSRASAD
jgi:hypothetical protein